MIINDEKDLITVIKEVKNRGWYKKGIVKIDRFILLLILLDIVILAGAYLIIKYCS